MHQVPEELVGLLMTAIRIAAQGAVAISTVVPELTTSEAANLLGVSRPTMIKLIDSDQIPGHRVGSGSHRRELRKDVRRSPGSGPGGGVWATASGAVSGGAVIARHPPLVLWVAHRGPGCAIQARISKSAVTIFSA